MPNTAVELEPTDPRDDPDEIVTVDRAMVAILRTVRQVAPTDVPVLILGETGTGKEHLARVIHRSSQRNGGPFVALNCAAAPESLIGPELLADAHRGTLFLDAIGDLPLDLQPNLLRLLQSGEFTCVGSAQPETADIRVIAATNCDLQREVAEGRFRSDLFDRLSGVTLKLPPLRERPHDIYLLAPFFLRRYAARYSREAPTLDLGTLVQLAGYGFPGNVRELESEMARLVAVSPPGAVLGPEALRDCMRAQTPQPQNK